MKKRKQTFAPLCEAFNSQKNYLDACTLPFAMSNPQDAEYSEPRYVEEYDGNGHYEVNGVGKTWEKDYKNEFIRVLDKSLIDIGYLQDKLKWDVIDSKALFYIIHKLKKANQYNQKAPTVFNIVFDVNEFASICGETFNDFTLIDDTTMTKDKKDRIKSNSYSYQSKFKDKVQNSLNKLEGVKITTAPTKYGKKANKKHPIVDNGFTQLLTWAPLENGNFSVEFYSSMARFILTCAPFIIPNCLMGLNGDSKTAYFLGLNIWKYYTYDGNVDNNRNGNLCVKTLLEYANVTITPSKKKYWTSNLKKKLERYLDILVSCGLFTYWNYEDCEPVPGHTPHDKKFKKKGKAPVNVWMDSKIYFESSIDVGQMERREKSKERKSQRVEDAKMRKLKNQNKALKQNNEMLKENNDLKKEAIELDKQMKAQGITSENIAIMNTANPSEQTIDESIYTSLDGYLDD